jgi:hypothetical protein
MKQPLFIFVLLVCAFLIAWYSSRCIIEGFAKKEPKLQELKKKIAPIFEGDQRFEGVLDQLNYRNILSEIEFYGSNKSYTLNKTKVHICMKDSDGEYYPDSTLIYVILHEVAHCINPTIGHDESFQMTFNELLKIAERKGIYDPNVSIVQNYCGYT